MNERSDSLDVKTAIVDAAVQLFERQGYEATAISQIVDLIGATKGAFYHYFDTKEDLLLLIHERFIEQQLRTVRRIDAEHRDPRESLELIIEAIIESVRTHQSYIAVFFEQRRFLADIRFREIKHKRDEFEAVIVSIVDRGVAAGVFRDVASSRLAAFGIIGMCTWAYQWYRPEMLSPKEIGQMYASLVLDGLSTVDG